MSIYILSLCIGYLIGSFPTAYVIVKRKAALDIRGAGSGNVGARNASEVTGSMAVGISVLILDLLKGVCAVYAASLISDGSFWMRGVCGIGAVLGHNYSPWIGFRGGRGLAATAGVMLMLGWIYVFIWLIIYGICQVFAKQIHLSTILASVASPFVIPIIPEPLAETLPFLTNRLSDIFILCLILSLIISIGHIGLLRELVKTKRGMHS